MIQKFVKSLFSFFNNLKLIQKLLLSYIILIILPLMLLSFLLYGNVSKIIEDHVIYSAKQSFEQANSFLTDRFHNIAEKSNVLTNNNLLINVTSSGSSSDLHEQVKSTNELSLLLTSMEDGIKITRIRLFVPDEYYFSNDGRNIFGLRSIENEKWYALLKKSDQPTLWSPSSYLADKGTRSTATTGNRDNDEVLALARKIYHPNDYSKIAGVIRLDFPKSSIVSILSKANTTSDSLSYIQCSNGAIFADSSSSLLEKYELEYDVFAHNPGIYNNWIYITINKEKALVTCRLIGNTDLSMVTVIPFGGLIEDSKKIQNFVIILLIVISTISFLFAYYISYSITKKIKLLADKMKDVHNGKLMTVDIPHSSDEIGGLIEDYNYMTGKMADLIEEQYESGQRLRNAELKILQAQVNPHFLYNTLDMINWHALKNEGAEIVTIVDSLAKFYKLSLNKGNEIVTLKEELMHVQSYFHIQNLRYKNIKMNILVPEELFDLTLPKIILQPIVENAILHGILYKEGKSGTVTISGRQENDIILLKVDDDGIGIPPDKLEKLQSGQIKSNRGSGFGVRNINERIQLYYGIDYGLSYTSKYGKGTSVEIRIPSHLAV